MVLVGTGKLLSQGRPQFDAGADLHAIRTAMRCASTRRAICRRASRSRSAGPTWSPTPTGVTGVTSAAANSMGLHRPRARRERHRGASSAIPPLSWHRHVHADLADHHGPCSPSGVSRIYAGDFTTGLSVLVNSAGGVINARSQHGRHRSAIPERRRQVLTHRRNREGRPASTAATRSTVGLRRINWREVNLGN